MNLFALNILSPPLGAAHHATKRAADCAAHIADCAAHIADWTDECAIPHSMAKHPLQGFMRSEAGTTQVCCVEQEDCLRAGLR